MGGAGAPTCTSHAQGCVTERWRRSLSPDLDVRQGRVEAVAEVHTPPARTVLSNGADIVTPSCCDELLASSYRRRRACRPDRRPSRTTRRHVHRQRAAVADERTYPLVPGAPCGPGGAVEGAPSVESHRPDARRPVWPRRRCLRPGGSLRTGMSPWPRGIWARRPFFARSRLLALEAPGRPRPPGPAGRGAWGRRPLWPCGPRSDPQARGRGPRAR